MIQETENYMDLIADVYVTPNPIKVHDDFQVLVLSGGSTRGIVQLGMLYALHEQKKLSNIQLYVGTSIGSIINLLLLVGYTPLEIFTFVCTTQLSLDTQSINVLTLLTEFGLFSLDPFFEHIENKIIDKLDYVPSLKELYENYGKHFVSVTYNLSKRKLMYISHETHPDLCCIDALKMSANIPLIFHKYIYDGDSYIDGGFFDQFAIKYSKFYIEHIGHKEWKIFGLATDILQNDELNANNTNIFNYVYALLSLSLHNNKVQSFAYKSSSSQFIVLTLKTSSNIVRAMSNQDKIKYFLLGFHTMQKYIITPDAVKTPSMLQNKIKLD